ncbi:MAG: hypothetical protein HKL83_05645 [Acidimicrobiaceae bacterium]|nr:hypothetical protein [Acidimicrobiaceae bacterium]
MTISYEKLLELARLDDEVAHSSELLLRSLKRKLLSELEVERAEAERRLVVVDGGIGELEEESSELSAESELISKKLSELETAEQKGLGISHRNVEVLAHEIEVLHVRAEEIELRQLEIMESFEDLSAKKDEIDGELAELDTVFQRTKQEYDTEVLDSHDLVDGLEKQRSDLVKELPSEFLPIYERLRSAKLGRAFAYVVKGVCLGCRVKVSPLELTRLKQSKEFAPEMLPRCQECDRIMLLP